MTSILTPSLLEGILASVIATGISCLLVMLFNRIMKNKGRKRFFIFLLIPQPVLTITFIFLNWQIPTYITIFLSGLGIGIFLSFWWLGILNLRSKNRSDVIEILPEKRIADIRELVQIDEGWAYMQKLCETLRKAHVEAKPLVAFMASEAAFNLTTVVTGRSGAFIKLDGYMKLLRISFANKNLKDITYIAKTKPSLWFGEDNDLKKHAMAYFNEQRDLKKKSPRLLMRRFLLISQQEWDSDLKDHKKHVENFINMHIQAGIDLIHFPLDALSESQKLAVKDMAVFFCSKGFEWRIQSDFEEDKVKAGIVNAHVEHEQRVLQDLHTDFLQTLFNCYINDNSQSPPWNDRLKTPQLTNKPSDDFLKAHNLSPE